MSLEQGGGEKRGVAEWGGAGIHRAGQGSTGRGKLKQGGVGHSGNLRG